MESKSIALILTLLGTITVLYNVSTQENIKPQVTEFQNWIAKYNVKYQSAFEKAYRQKIFLKNFALIQTHNSKPKTYFMGVNQFTALTQEQFVATYLGLIPQLQTSADNQQYTPNAEIDWRKKGAVTPIKNQAACGADYAFSSVGALEGLSKIAYGSLQSFSQQQLVDCTSAYGNKGCEGGLMINAFKYVKDKGIATEDEYPYKGVARTCRADGGKFKISSYVNITNCNDLSTAITKGVVSVAVDASNWGPYHNGTLMQCKTTLNHGVLLVGTTFQGHWIVKNSWGAYWGQNGYITIKGGNTCGICNMASYPNK